MCQNILPENNQMPKTPFKLFQYVIDLVPSCEIVIKHFYCKECHNYIGIDEKNSSCLCCNSKKISFSFEIDICSQIKDMFETRNLAEKLKFPLLRDENVIAE